MVGAATGSRTAPKGWSALEPLVYILLGCYLRDIEHFSESKMAAATMLDVLKFPIVDPDDLQGRVVPMYRGCGCWLVRGIF